MASKISKEEIDIINQFHKAMRKYGWKPMESKYGSAWFGGKSHKGLQKYIPEESEISLISIFFFNRKIM